MSPFYWTQYFALCFVIVVIEQVNTIFIFEKSYPQFRAKVSYNEPAVIVIVEQWNAVSMRVSRN